MRKFTGVFVPFLFAFAAQAQQGFLNGQAARAVIGQVNFTYGSNLPTQQILGGASGVAWANGRLYVADSNRIAASPEDHRVLVFDTTQIPGPLTEVTSDGTVAAQGLCYLCGFKAINSLGQPSFTPTDTSDSPAVFDPGLSGSSTAPQFNNATAVATDGTILAVADTDNNRVLIWTTIPTTIDQSPNLVLGQPDFTTRQQQSVGQVTATAMRGPQGVWIQNGKIFVADTQNYRILIWNSIPATNNQTPDLVLGQPDFVHANAPPPTTASPTAAANQLLNPVSVTSDGTHLFVADLGFNRVLIWNTIPTTMDQNADVVIGQPDMASTAANNATVCGSNSVGTVGQCVASLNYPRFALSDGRRLFVADGGNDRVLIFNAIPTANGASADRVLGEPDFTTDIVTSQSITIASTAIDNTGAVDTVPTPTSLAWDGTNLYVADPYNRRVLLFSDASSPLTSGSVVNWASEIVRQEGTVVFTGTIAANDTTSITIQSTAYTYTIKSGDTLDTVAQALVKLINASDPNVTAIFAGLGTGTVYLSSKGTNLGYDTITLTATSGTSIVATASGAYLFAGTAATASAGALIEVNAPPGVNFTDDTSTLISPLSGTIPNMLGGVQLYLDGFGSPLYKVSPTQIVGQIPYFYTDRNSTSVYVRTVHNDGSVTVTNATPVYIAPANPGIFDAPGYAGQSRPWPASMAYHQPGNATSVIDLSGTPNSGDTITITIAGTAYTYTETSSDTLVTIVQALVKLINATDTNVTASVGEAFNRVVLTAKKAGAAGTGITVAASASSSAKITPTAYSSATCCDVSPGSLIYPGNPAAPGELITVYAAGLGQVLDLNGNSFSVVTGQPFNGPTPNEVISFVSATMSTQSAQVVGAGLATGSYGMYQVQIIVPTGLATNDYTQLYIAQNAFISNTVTIPVGPAVATPAPPPPTAVTSPITLNIDTPAAGKTIGGLILVGGWAVDNNTSVGSVSIAIDGATLADGSAAYGIPRPDVCHAYPNRPGCPNVGWNYFLDTTQLANGRHSIDVTVTDNNGAHLTGTTAVTVANAASANPVHIGIDYPAPGGSYRGLVRFFGSESDPSFPAAPQSVTGTIDGSPSAAILSSSVTPCVSCGYNDILFNIDLSQITNGVHTFGVTVVSAAGQRAASQVIFTVANLTAASSNGQPIISIDVPNSSSAAFSGVAHFGGWALDISSNMANVTVAVDGVAMPASASYGGARSDVCAVYVNYPNCPNVGWNAAIDTTLLADGSHTLAVTANPYAGQSYTKTATFTVSNMSSSSLLVDIDMPNAGTAALSGTALIGGWAISASSPIVSLKALVDGAVSFGTVGYGGARPDVCAKYPASLGCPNVGWDGQLDTTLLANGSHTLEITGTTASGQRATASSSFTVSNGATGPGHVNIDQPNTTNIPYAGLANFSGWALNDTSRIASVAVAVDGVPIGSAAYGNSRPDVCVLYPGRLNCPNVGWTYTLDTTQFADGTHSFGISATAANGTVTTLAASFIIANYSAVKSPILINIDTPNSQETFPYYGSVHFGGWALDNSGSIASVSVTVDGTPFGSAGYGGSRPDVCTVFSGRANCPNVGWNFLLDTTLIPDGQHTLGVTAITTLGQSYNVAATFYTAN